MDNSAVKLCAIHPDLKTSTGREIMIDDCYNYSCVRDKLPNVVRDKPLEPFELFFIDMAKTGNIQKEAKNVSSTKNHFLVHGFCKDCKRLYKEAEVKIYLGQLNKNGQTVDMNEMEILYTIATETIEPEYKNKKCGTQKEEDDSSTYGYITSYISTWEKRRDRSPYADLLVGKLCRYFNMGPSEHRCSNEIPKNRIGIFYVHINDLTYQVFLISGKDLWIKTCILNPRKKIYIFMRVNDKSIISIIPIYRELFLTALSSDVILKQMIASKKLMKENMQKLPLPQSTIQSLMIQAESQVFHT